MFPMCCESHLIGNDNSEAEANASSSPEAIADNALQVAITGAGELDVPTMKKYIQYCKAKCRPHLSEEAGEVLVSSYVKIRDDVRRRAIEASAQRQGNDEDNVDQVIPITVMQLEALVRLSESLSKMRLEEDVQTQDIAGALRLFKVSTMAANAADKGGVGASASAGASVGGKNNNSIMRVALPSREEMLCTETFLRSRLKIGHIVNKQRQGYDATVVMRAIAIMVMKGEMTDSLISSVKEKSNYVKTFVNLIEVLDLLRKALFSYVKKHQPTDTMFSETIVKVNIEVCSTWS